MNLLVLGFLACVRRPIEDASSRGVVVPETFEPTRVLAVVASDRADPPLVDALRAGSVHVSAVTGARLTGAALEAALAEQLGRAGPRDTVVISLSTPLASGGDIAFLGADARIQGGRLRGALSLDRLESLFLESAAGRVIVLVDPASALSESMIVALDGGLKRLSLARAGVVAARVRAGASPLCVRDLDGDGVRSVGELSVALGGRAEVASAHAEIPWAADQCGGPGPVTICLFEDGAPVPPSNPFPAGSSLSLSISNVPQGYVSVLSFVAEGSASLLVPRPKEPPLAVGPDGGVRLPASGEVLRLSGGPGVEHLSLIWTMSPVQGLEALQSALTVARAGEAALTAQARAVDRCAQYTPVGDASAWAVDFSLTRQ